MRYTHTHTLWGVFRVAGAERWGRTAGAVRMGEVHMCLLRPARKAKHRKLPMYRTNQLKGFLLICRL